MTKDRYDHAMTIMGEIRSIEGKRTRVSNYLEKAAKNKDENNARSFIGYLFDDDNMIVALNEKDLITLIDHWEAEEKALEREFDEL